MAQLFIANIGSYSRTGENKDQQRYRRGFGHFERKEISAHAFRDVEQSVVQEIIHEQLQCHLDEITDGLIAWEDPISHFCKNWSGIERGPITQYFNNNFYYRRPTIVSKPRSQGSVLLKEFQYAQSLSAQPVRAVLTGPVTLASHSDGEAKPYSTLQGRIDFFTDLLGQEIKALAGAGAKVFQIDEPSVAANAALLPVLKKSLPKLTALAPNATFVLALYFAPLADLWNGLQDVPVTGLNLDLTLGRASLLEKMMASPGTKEIGLGIVDARSTRVEKPEDEAVVIKKWLEKTPAARAYATPSAGLEFLPRASALGKLGLLRSIRTLAQNPSTNETPVSRN